MNDESCNHAWITNSACNHVWITNSGRGGEPVFRPNRQMGDEPLMHVRCERCRARTWFTEGQWYAMAESGGDHE